MPVNRVPLSFYGNPKEEEEQSPIALPFGGMVGENLDRYIQANTGPVADVGLNPAAMAQLEGSREIASAPAEVQQAKDSVVKRLVASTDPNEQKRQHMSDLLNRLRSSNFDEDKELDAAVQSRNLVQLMAGLGQAGSTIGAGISKGTVAPNTAFFERLAGQAGQPIDDVKTKRQQADQRIQREAAQLKLGKETDLLDPNSEISKSRRELYAQALKGVGIEKLPGFNEMSAYDLDSSQSVLSMAERALQRKHERELLLESKNQQQEDRKTQTENKDIRDLRRDVISGKMGDLYMNVQGARKAKESITDFMKNPSGYSDYGTLLIGLKALQGDQSVVRGEEIKLGMQAGSLMDTITTMIKRPATGQTLTPKQRKAILNAVDTLHKKSVNQYLDGISPIIDETELRNIDKKRVLPKDILDAFEKQSAPKQKVKLPGNYAPGTVLNTKIGRVVVSEDGKTGTVE